MAAPETRASATAADGVILSACSALTAFAIGTVSHYVGMWQGLPEGRLRAGFQGATTLLLTGDVLVALFLLRCAPADMVALRQCVSRRAVATGIGSKKS